VKREMFSADPITTSERACAAGGRLTSHTVGLQPSPTSSFTQSVGVKLLIFLHSIFVVADVQLQQPVTDPQAMHRTFHARSRYIGPTPCVKKQATFIF